MLYLITIGQKKATFSVEHGQTYKNGGLIIKLHDEIEDMLATNVVVVK